MSDLELKTYPDPCLRAQANPVEKFDQELSTTLRSMADIMYTSQGIGLAAPQVGLGLSAIVIDIGEGLINLVNPTVVERSKKKLKMEEGCLSLPGVTVTVARPESVKVRFQNEEGEFIIKKYEGLTATAVQHEIDHLTGRLIIDYLNPISHFIAKRKLTAHKTQVGGKTCEVVCHVREENK